jgi:general secretion pathway protein J
MTGPGRRRAAGFTLLELLVAMALMALVALILAGGLQFATRAWHRAQAASDEMARVAGVHDALTTLFGRARRRTRRTIRPTGH